MRELKNSILLFLRSGSEPKNYFRAFIVFWLGMALTGIVVLHVRQNALVQKQIEFAGISNDLKIKITTRLYSHAQLLRAGSALFAVSDTITRSKWKEFADHLNFRKNLPGVQGFGYAILIPHHQLQHHTEVIRTEGFREYQVHPVGERELYSSVIFLEPFSDRNLRAFGYDMLTEPIRRQGLELARDSNLAVITGKITLVQETNEDVQAGALMFVPVYQRNKPIQTTAQRRAAIRGWVYLPYRMNDLMQGILDRYDLEQNGKIHLQIYDKSISASSLLYDSQTGNQPDPSVVPSRSLLLPVDFHGSNWLLHFSQTDQENIFLSERVFVIFLGGAIISFLLMLLTFSLLNTITRAQRIAKKLFADLKEIETHYKLVVENISDVVVVQDLETRNFTFASPSFSQLFGYSEEERKQLTLGNLLTVDSLNRLNSEIPGRIERYMSGQRESFLDEIQCIHKNGNRFWVEVSSHIVRNPDNHRLEVIQIVRDISKRHEAEEELRLSQNFLNSIIEQSPNSLWISDAQGNLIRINQACRDHLQIRDEEVIGKYNILEDSLMQSQGFIPGLKEVFEKGIPMRFVIEYNTALLTNVSLDKHVNLVLNVNISPVFDQYGKVNNAVIQHWDITERIRAEEALKLSEARFKAILLNSFDPVGVHSNGIWEICNPAALKLFGFNSEEELIGTPVINQVAPEERERIENYIGVRMEDGTAPLSYVTIGMKRDGSKFDMEIKISTYVLENKRYILVIIRDITESLRAQQLLIESEARFHNMADTAPVMLWKSEVDGSSSYVNKPWLDFTGRTLEQELGNGWIEGIHPEDLRKSLDTYFEALNKRAEFRFEYRLRSAQGTYRWVLTHGVPRFNPEGKFLGFIGSGVDITERMENEKIIETLSVRNKTLLQTAGDGIHILDLQGNIVEANTSFCKMLGYSSEEILKLNVADFDIQWSREELPGIIQHFFENPAIFETKNKSKDGTVLDVEVNCTGINLEGKDYLFASSRDITDRKAKELLLAKNSEELLRINAEKDKFFSIIAHDLRSPFNGFLGLTQMMVEEMPTFKEEELMQIASNMRSSALNLFSLLENLLEWSRMQQGLIPYLPENLNLSSLVRDSINVMMDAARIKEIRIINMVQDDLMVYADKRILQTIIRNLVSNGVKFTRKGGDITVAAALENESSVLVSVRDTGIGMNREMVGNLFRLGTNVSRIGTDNEPSTGLGLIICKDFVERNGGKMWVESEVGKGSTFNFTVPSHC